MALSGVINPKTGHDYLEWQLEALAPEARKAVYDAERLHQQETVEERYLNDKNSSPGQRIVNVAAVRSTWSSGPVIATEQPKTLGGKFKKAASKIFAPSEFPNLMSSMVFSEVITVPYTTTIYGWSNLLNTCRVTYDPPIVENREYHPTEYKWYEAHKVNTAEGARYSIVHIQNVVPGLNKAEDKTEAPKSVDGKALFTKAEAIGILNAADAVLARDFSVAQDASKAKKHYARYKI